MLRKSLTALAIAGVALGASSAVAKDMKEIRFGIISTESTLNLQKIWEPFLKRLSEKIGRPVKGLYASDYAGVIEAMRFKKVELAWFGNKSAIVAVDRSGGEVFAQTVDADGNPGYWSLLVTHKDSKLNSMKDALACKTCTFCNGDPNSTSGYAVPGYYVFALNAIEPRKHFKRVTNAGHEANLLSAVTKKCDFASNNTENVRRFELTFPKRAKLVKVIWKSPLIPADPLVWRKDLPAETKAAIKAAILGFGKTGPKAAEEKKLLASLQWAPFRASSNAQLAPIRRLELFKAKLKIERASKGREMTADEKKKVEAINASLKKLEASNSN
ncbi:MAG: phosphonate ABC transporter substrate-binding protein [Bauldia litoralis]